MGLLILFSLKDLNFPSLAGLKESSSLLIASNEYNKTYIKVTDNGSGTYSPIYTSKEGGKRRSRTRRRKAKAKARKSRRSRR